MAHHLSRLTASEATESEDSSGMYVGGSGGGGLGIAAASKP
jgi:hypothetical protein